VDLVVGEHKGPHLRLQLLENDGYGGFLIREIDRGKESHLGTLVADLDADGDPDIVSIPWDRYRDLSVWRNDRFDESFRVCWRRLSNHSGEFARAGVAQQSSAVVADIDRDGRDDFVIAGWSPKTSMVWFRSTAKGPERHLIDDRQSHIEAGGVAFDMDGDGDLDILQKDFQHERRVDIWFNDGPSECPAPSFEPSTPLSGG
jgi:hypothetical protein